MTEARVYVDTSLYLAQLLGDKRAQPFQILLREVTRDLCLNNEYPAVRMPRSQDLVHLRTACWFQKHGGLEAFLSLDQTHSGAAIEMGLPVLTL